MSGILQCVYDLCGLLSDKQSGGTPQVAQKQNIPRDEEQNQKVPNENEYLLDGVKATKPGKDYGDNDEHVEIGAELRPPSGGENKTSEYPAHIDDAKSEVPSSPAVQQDEVLLLFLSV